MKVKIDNVAVNLFKNKITPEPYIKAVKDLKEKLSNNDPMNVLKPSTLKGHYDFLSNGIKINGIISHTTETFAVRFMFEHDNKLQHFRPLDKRNIIKKSTTEQER